MYVADDQELCVVAAVEAILLSRLLVLIADPVHPRSLFLTYHRATLNRFEARQAMSSKTRTLAMTDERNGGVVYALSVADM
jgi:hypothetical protein